METRTAAVSSLVTQTQMRDLPLNGRNFASLLTLAPGVQTIPQSPAGGGGSATFYGQGTNSREPTSALGPTDLRPSSI